MTKFSSDRSDDHSDPYSGDRSNDHTLPPSPRVAASPVTQPNSAGLPADLQFKETLLLIGRGRLAQALIRWPKSPQIEIRSWHRSLSLDELDRALDGASHVLLAIRDDALESFIAEHAARLQSKTLLHFAGSRGDFTHHNVRCFVAHPLVSLSTPPPPAELLQHVRFSISGAKGLSELLPGFSNPSFILPDHERALYHALLSLGGNLGVWLWERMEREFTSQFQFAPHEEMRTHLMPYLESLFWALRTRAADASALTGPISREDLGTIARQSSALSSRTELHRIFDLICHQALAERRLQTQKQKDSI
ncbi:MAG TPA: DUF2520 domain-containing protein [Pseudobdellovibrionaceae bacterium]|nr:DUF2520 domain-containing protein [Pseudobdellovibrionaceae bacterium]